MATTTPPRGDRAAATREAILDTAERLFAEHGVHAVSNRQISEAAGQGNTAAVGYHFGTKHDLVRAIVRRHSADVDRLRTAMVEAALGSTDVRDWVACLVRPMTEHLDALGSPTWFARFAAQIMTDPAMREVLAEESLSAPSLRAALDGLEACLPALPPEVRAERGDMVRQLMMHVPAQRERALAEGRPTPRATWDDAATGLVDAVTGIWLAPDTPARR
ncbi:TetR/AcrR family transcriptional regulator [Pseudonocardia benzenivorans]|jgi:AcrR family transcriptional regulator|uniref:Regulatory protein TetR n=2 Tax=Pseudonocardia TaxID=1847 RepID=F4CY56_PSEUX|nr:TetR family transcriptional regulator [Pseudonocardia dioxanivorans]AEA24678.1 regulatory protein TetR [Pseudonocardia dioxanivorans CB1190]GJF04617.1 TetR family transcriptional regulator [Pseudonocardia sp. D17]